MESYQEWKRQNQTSSGGGQRMFVGVWEEFCRWLAWRLPRSVAVWATIRVATYASGGEWSDQDITTLTVVSAVQRWEGERPDWPEKKNA